MMLLILRLLEEKDMYGYEMIEALREKSQNVFELKAGTLYPLLHGLEEKNFVTSYEQKVMGKERKYYRLTAAGHGRLEEKKDVPTKGMAISKAIEIILNGLKVSLDYEAGGELAQRLGALYDYMTQRLLYANLHNSRPAMDEVTQLLTDLKSAWEAIGSSEQAPR